MLAHFLVAKVSQMALGKGDKIYIFLLLDGVETVHVFWILGIEIFTVNI